MAKQLLIKAKPREKKKPNALRQEGFIPATLYGHHFEPKSIQINTKEFSKVPHRAYSHINALEIEGEENHDVLIKNVQKDPVKDNFLNIEFYKITKGEKVKVKVPIRYEGHSPAITAGGVLIISFDELEIQCLPKDIPDDITINLEQIVEIGQAILIKDLKVPEGVQFLQQSNETIAKVEIPKEHKVEEEAPAVVAGEVPATEVAAPTAEGEAAATTKEGGKEAAKKEPAAKEVSKKEEPKGKK